MRSIRKGSVVFIFKIFASVRVLRTSGGMAEALTRGFPNKKAEVLAFAVRLSYTDAPRRNAISRYAVSDLAIYGIQKEYLRFLKARRIFANENESAVRRRWRKNTAER